MQYSSGQQRTAVCSSGQQNQRLVGQRVRTTPRRATDAEREAGQGAAGGARQATPTASHTARHSIVVLQQASHRMARPRPTPRTTPHACTYTERSALLSPGWPRAPLHPWPCAAWAAAPCRLGGAYAGERKGGHAGQGGKAAHVSSGTVGVRGARARESSRLLEGYAAWPEVGQ